MSKETFDFSEALRLLWLYAMENSFLVFSKILRIFSQQTGRRWKDEEEV